MARPKKTMPRNHKVMVALSEPYGQALDAWADEERRPTATWANMLMEKLIDARTLLAEGRQAEADAIFAELKANCENRTRDLRFTKPLVGITPRAKRRRAPRTNAA